MAGEGGRSGKGQDETHTVPLVAPMEPLESFVLGRVEHDETDVRRYVEMEADETVTHLERVKTEYVFGRQHDAWDVHTTKGRWWVVTDPTNLYSQETFPSLDYTLSFHIGLITRMAAQQAQEAPEEPKSRLPGAYRLWEQAAQALESSSEVEDFQAVGNRCRAALLELVKELADVEMVPTGESPPQRSNFVAWSELIANAVAPGSSADRLRGYLKGIAKETWQLVSWLVHAGGAVRFDAQVALDATRNVLDTYAAAFMRHEAGAPDRCAVCGSYKLSPVYRPDLDLEPPYQTVCEASGMTEPPEP